MPFLIDALTFGNVLRHDECGGTPGIFHGVQKNLHVDDGSVLQAMMPLSGRFLANRAIVKHLEQPGNFLGRMKVTCAHPQEFDPCVPIVVNGGIIDLEKLQAFLFKHPHGKRVMCEEE